MRRTSSVGAAVSLAVTLAAGTASASEHPMDDCPMHAQHQAGTSQDQERADQGMGFSQEKTTHHFLLAPDGGRIQVTANSAGDRATVDQVRAHLKHVARAFQAGDFAIPMFVHGQTPSGVSTLQRLKAEIAYSYERQSNGGSVVIRTKNPEAVAAVQEFLRFQIREHSTGDPVRSAPTP